MDNGLKYWVWLSTLYRIKTNIKHSLLKLYGKPENIWKAEPAELRELPLIDASIYGQLLNEEARARCEGLLREIYDLEMSVITYEDTIYPAKLKEVFDPPVVLYTKGRPLRREEPMIAIVGSRKADTYGKEVARKLAYDLTTFGVTVVSGMARGIDSYAHLGALDAGGRTAAVMGCGLDIIYPPENRALFADIEKEGVLVSEYPPGMSPLRPNFIARNRIISGMSYGVVVVQAGTKSGSLITSNYAAEQGREVFAVPGNITDRLCSGTNALIKDGAAMVTGARDVLEELGWFKDGESEVRDGKKINGNEEWDKPNRISAGLTGEERCVVEQLRGGRLHFDEIEAKTGFDIGSLNTLLLLMEMKGVISQAPGRVYTLTRRS